MFKYLTVNNTFNYIDTLDKMIKKYNSTLHSFIKMKPKDAVHNRNNTKVYNEIYKPIYPSYKFDICDKVRSVKRKRHLSKDIR